MARVLVAIVYTCLLFATGSLAQGDNSQEFLIGSGDVISIEVYNERDLTVRAKVGQTGVLRIPLLGDKQVAGKTPSQLSRELEDAYFDGYLVNPSVSVVIEKFRPLYVRGAVKSPGAYEFALGLTVDQALAVAGGLKDRASKDDWYVIRGPEKTRVKVSKETKLMPGDILDIEESLF